MAAASRLLLRAGDADAVSSSYAFGAAPTSTSDSATGAVAPVDAVLVATGLWATVHGVTSLAIAMPRYAPQMLEPLLDHLLAVQLRGLSP